MITMPLSIKSRERRLLLIQDQLDHQWYVQFMSPPRIVRKVTLTNVVWCRDRCPSQGGPGCQGWRSTLCAFRHEGQSNFLHIPYNRDRGKGANLAQMESVVSSPVSGKVKRVLVVENDSIAQGDLVCEITH